MARLPLRIDTLPRACPRLSGRVFLVADLPSAVLRWAVVDAALTIDRRFPVAVEPRIVVYCDYSLPVTVSL